jgi:dipeptide/tripeptide permease
VTTPAQDAPLVFPSVAFRPIRLFLISLGITALAVIAAVWAGHPKVGMFFGIGLLLGLLNAVLVQRSVNSITAKENPAKSSMALNSAVRLAIITVVGLIIAFTFRPEGLGVVFGLALFQVLLVAATALPVWKKLRSGEGISPAGQLGASEGTEERTTGDD